MIVTNKLGNIKSFQHHDKYVDWLHIEWYEAAKRIMHQRSEAGREVVIKFMGESQQLTQGDILFEDADTIISVDILPCNSIVIFPSTMYEMACVCYEIGNKHLPLFFEDGAVLVPFDLPLFKLLTAQGYNIKQEERKLLQPLKTTVSPHGTATNNETIFSKIMKLTASPNPLKEGLKKTRMQEVIRNQPTDFSIPPSGGGALLSLLQLADPALPIGGFSHSAGLETYVQEGVVRDVATAKEFITQMLLQNLQYTDAAFVSLAYDATAQNKMDEILSLDMECTAVKLPMEMRQASIKMGMRLMKIFQPVCNNELIAKYKRSIADLTAAGHYSIVFGIYAFALGINKTDALTGFYYNAASGMVTNSVKLIPLSQQAGQELLFSLQTLIAQLTKQTMRPDKELLGLCCSGFDIRSMQHERLYSRLYMS